MLLTLLSSKSKANADFNFGARYKNIEINYEEVPGTVHQTKMYYLAYLMHELSRQLHRQNIKVVLNHNMRYWSYQDAKARHKNLDTLNIGYENNYRDPYSKKMSGPAICIYHYGNLNLENQLSILYYAFTHLDEIEKRQKYITTLYRYSDRLHLAVSQKDLGVSNMYNTAADRLIAKNKFSLWYDKNLPEIDFYYNSGTYHIIKRDIPQTKPETDYPIAPANGKEIIRVKDIFDIVRFVNRDYFIFDSNSSFYYWDEDIHDVSGPFQIAGMFPQCREHYFLNDLYILKISRSTLYYRAAATIVFDRKMKRVASDELKILLLAESGILLQGDSIN